MNRMEKIKKRLNYTEEWGLDSEGTQALFYDVHYLINEVNSLTRKLNKAVSHIPHDCNKSANLGYYACQLEEPCLQIFRHPKAVDRWEWNGK